MKSMPQDHVKMEEFISIMNTRKKPYKKETIRTSLEIAIVGLLECSKEYSETDEKLSFQLFVYAQYAEKILNYFERNIDV